MRSDQNRLRLDIIDDEGHIHNGNDRSMAVEDMAFDDPSTRSQSQGGSR
jgi:hypothetical protein